MRSYCLALTAFSLFAAPAAAQTTAVAAAPTAETKPQVVKKRVCKREANVGSLVGNERVCRMVEVPQPAAANVQKTQTQQRPGSESGANN